MSDTTVTKKIAKLFALAASNSNRNEAEAAMKKAQALLTEHNLTMADVGTNEEKKSNMTNENFEVNWKNESLTHRFLIDILVSHFFVEVLINRKSAALAHRASIKLFGDKENVDSAIFAYNFLYKTFNRLWNAKKKTLKTFGEASGSLVKNSFLAGLHSGLSSKLQEQKEETVSEKYDNNQEKTSTALAVINDKELIKQFLRTICTPGKDMKSPKSKCGSSSAYQSGVAKGRKINISKAIA